MLKPIELVLLFLFICVLSIEYVRLQQNISIQKALDTCGCTQAFRIMMGGDYVNTLTNLSVNFTPYNFSDICKGVKSG